MEDVISNSRLAAGIWVGKRPLGGLIKLQTHIPLFEPMHWCVMISGVLYQVGVNKANDKELTVSTHIDAEEKRTFEWSHFGDDPLIRNQEDFAKYINEVILPLYRYEALTFWYPNDAKKINCQSFVAKMINVAINADEEEYAMEEIYIRIFLNGLAGSIRV